MSAAVAPHIGRGKMGRVRVRVRGLGVRVRPSPWWPWYSSSLLHITEVSEI
jgi:hypothetical protein